MVITGNDDAATLHAAYRYAEKLGVFFGLAEDVIPDAKITLDITGFDEVGEPLFPTRGIQPYHDFPPGPDLWNTDDYLTVISQLPKLGMNFIGIHTYTKYNSLWDHDIDARRGPEPSVWIGLPEDINADGTVTWSYPAYYAHTKRPDYIWGFDTWDTDQFHGGASQLFERNAWGSDVFGTTMPSPGNMSAWNQVHNQVGQMFNEAFTHAQNLGVKTASGTELTLGEEYDHGDTWVRGMPTELQTRLTGMGKDPADPCVVKDVYKGIFERIMKTHPLDYYWLWSYEIWSSESVGSSEIASFENDMYRAQEALAELGNPFQIGHAGWRLGTVNPLNPAEFEDVFPPEAPFFSLWGEATGYESLSAERVKWPATWLEYDWGLAQPQLAVYRVHEDAKAAWDKDCDGLISEHWRTRIMSANVGSMKDLLWCYGPTGSPVTKTVPSDGGAFVDSYYLDWAERQFGPEKASEIAAIFSGQDWETLPHALEWAEEMTGSFYMVPGAILCNSADWSTEQSNYDFVGQLEALRPQIVGTGNLERFDYWLKAMQALKIMGEYGCIRDDFENACDAGNWNTALTYRQQMADLWEQLMTLMVEKCTNASDLGEIINLEIVNWKQLMMNKWDAEMENGLGEPLPPEANPSTDYTGGAFVKVAPARTQVNAGESLTLKVLIMENPTSVTLYYRLLGGGSYHNISLTNVARGVYEVTIPAQSDDFEYYIEAQTPIGNATFPVTAPSINQTVVVWPPETALPSPDMDDDGDVDFVDYAYFALEWLETGCGECSGADFTDDGNVDANDLDIFTDYWLSEPPNQPPVCTITAPDNHTKYTDGQVVSITASASDAGGSIEDVKFYVDDVLKTTDTSSPYSYDWTASGEGVHIVYAVATDNDGLTTKSRTVSVIVGDVIVPQWPGGTLPEEWPSYHLAHPDPSTPDCFANPGDGNGAIYYKDRYHFHYLLTDESLIVGDNPGTGICWAHVSSNDMVHWQWHPTVLTPPNQGHAIFSGTAFFTKESQPAIIYHGCALSEQDPDYNYTSLALDDNLDSWDTPQLISPVDPGTGEPVNYDAWWDPDCWLMTDTYYALSGWGDPKLMTSTDLQNWTWQEELFHPNYDEQLLGVPSSEDVSCANMFKIGDKWMLMCLSHVEGGVARGCRYYLGDFVDGKYLPSFHARMNWWDALDDDMSQVSLHAPESMLTPDGRRVMWGWLLADCPPSGIQSLPRELELPADGVLRIKPLTELQSLRYNEISKSNITITSSSDYEFTEPSGTAVEVLVTFEAPLPTEFGVKLLTDPGDDNGVTITAGKNRTDLQISERYETQTQTINPPFELGTDEDLTLRIFIDNRFVEVFANNRQAAQTFTWEYWRSNPNISLFTKDSDVLVSELKAWNMESPFTTEDTTPPSPDPMTWDTSPYSTGTSSVSMVATAATDVSGVEYYFDETSGNPGGDDSGWQDSTTYTDTGLNAGTEYCYQVKARDKSTNQNETGLSSSECATTEPSGCPGGVYTDYVGAGHDTDVTASAPSSDGDATPDNTINGSGLSGNQHSNLWAHTWTSDGDAGNPPAQSPNPARGSGQWIHYDLGHLYPLGLMHIWNGNEDPWGLGRGLKNVTIDYSQDNSPNPTSWTELGTFGPWPQAPGTNDYLGFDGPDFGGVCARHVLITINSNHGDDWGYALSEVKFNLEP